MCSLRLLSTDKSRHKKDEAPSTSQFYQQTWGAYPSPRLPNPAFTFGQSECGVVVLFFASADAAGAGTEAVVGLAPRFKKTFKEKQQDVEAGR